MNILDAIDRVVDRILWLLEKLTIGILFFMVMMVFLNACLRYFLGRNIMVSEELARFCFIWSCFVGALAIYKRKGHIVITILTDSLKGRAKAVVNAIARTITTIAIIFLCWAASLYFLNTVQYMNSGLRVNYGLIMSILPIMSFGMLFMDIIDFIHLFVPKTKAVLPEGEDKK